MPVVFLCVIRLLKSRSDAGGYSCVAENFAGPAEAPFKLTVLVKPYIEEAIDQNPRVVNNRTIVLRCPVLGISQPKVCLFYKHTNCYRELHYFGVSSVKYNELYKFEDPIYFKEL